MALKNGASESISFRKNRYLFPKQTVHNENFWLFFRPPSGASHCTRSVLSWDQPIWAQLPEARNAPSADRKPGASCAQSTGSGRGVVVPGDALGHGGVFRKKGDPQVTMIQTMAGWW